MSNSVIPLSQLVYVEERSEALPPNIDLQKLKELQERAAIARERALLQMSIAEAERILRTLETMNQIEEGLEQEDLTVEQKLVLLNAKQRIVDSGREFLAEREKRFIEGNDTTSRLDRLQREKRSPMMNQSVDPVRLSQIKAAIEQAISVKCTDRKKT